MAGQQSDYYNINNPYGGQGGYAGWYNGPCNAAPGGAASFHVSANAGAGGFGVGVYPPQVAQGVPVSSYPQAGGGVDVQNNMCDNGPHTSAPGVGGVRRGVWSASLCGCCAECGLCWEVCCFPWIVVSTQYNLTHHNQRRRVNWSVAVLSFCCPCALCFLAWFIREKTRARYGIDSCCCCDCFIGWACHCCALVQQARQMTAMGEPPGGLLYNPSGEPLILC